MSYEILAIRNSEELLIRNVNERGQQLLVADLRDLLQLHEAISAHLESKHIAQKPVQPATADEDIISAIQARELAEQQGVELNESTLRMAMQRGAIAGAHKRGGRWYLPEAEFLQWLGFRR